MSNKLIDNKKLMEEYNHVKNINLDINLLTCGMNKKIWWKCNNNHEWEASPNNRKNGTSCPYCAGKKVLKGYNDLESQNPKLAKEWNYKKNSFLPSEVMSNSNKKVWWICLKCNNQWEASVYTRNSGVGCPECARKKRIITRIKSNIQQRGSFLDKYPKLAKEWNYAKNKNMKPENFTANSNQVVWWIGNCGHEWKQMINSRTDGQGCPYCAGKKVLKGYNDLESQNPTLAKEWDYTKNHYLPSNYTCHSGKVVWWICPKGHNYNNSINHRSNGINCPICAMESQSSFPEQAIYYYLNKLTKAINRYTDLGKEIDIYLPDLKCGIEYNGIYYHKNKEAKDLDKIKYFFEKDIIIYTIEESNQNIINDNIIKFKYTYNYDNLIWAINALIKKLNLQEININIKEDSTEIYEQYISSNKINSIGNNNEDLILEWNYKKNGNLNPYMFSQQSHKKVWWLCKNNHEWQASIKSRNNGRKCPYCSHRKILKGFNDLQTINLDLIKEWDYKKNKILPNEVMPNSNKKVWWICSKCYYSWQANVCNRNKGSGCPVCSKQKTIIVLQYDCNNKLINKYYSIKEASIKTQINSSSIVSACKGRIKTAGGFIWKYDNDEK